MLIASSRFFYLKVLHNKISTMKILFSNLWSRKDSSVCEFTFNETRRCTVQQVFVLMKTMPDQISVSQYHPLYWMTRHWNILNEGMPIELSYFILYIWIAVVARQNNQKRKWHIRVYISHVQFKLYTTRDLGRPTGQSLKTPALHTVALHICLDVV